MYQKIVFETAEEFFEACKNGDPHIPETIYVVLHDNLRVAVLSGEGSEGFDLGHITKKEIIETAFHIAGIQVIEGLEVHLT